MLISHRCVASQGLADLTTDVPREFGGPGDQWSPEALLIAAVADCFVLTFRAIATPSRVVWHALDCDATGKLERVDRTTPIYRDSTRCSHQRS
jgi:organic hydroperoxide reductase OsmC/OhrA